MRSHKRVYNSLYQKAPSAKGHCRIFHTPAFEHGVPCNGLVLFRAENQTYRRIIAFHFAVLFVHADITVHLADILMGEFSDFENCSIDNSMSTLSFKGTVRDFSCYFSSDFSCFSVSLLSSGISMYWGCILMAVKKYVRSPSVINSGGGKPFAFMSLMILGILVHLPSGNQNPFL